jgi:hypothetical protein
MRCRPNAWQGSNAWHTQDQVNQLSITPRAGGSNDGWVEPISGAETT